MVASVLASSASLLLVVGRSLILTFLGQFPHRADVIVGVQINAQSAERTSVAWLVGTFALPSSQRVWASADH